MHMQLGAEISESIRIRAKDERAELIEETNSPPQVPDVPVDFPCEVTVSLRITPEEDESQSRIHPSDE